MPLSSGHGRLPGHVRLCDRCSNSDANGAHIVVRHLRSPHCASTCMLVDSLGKLCRALGISRLALDESVVPPMCEVVPGCGTLLLPSNVRGCDPRACLRSSANFCTSSPVVCDWDIQLPYGCHGFEATLDAKPGGLGLLLSTVQLAFQTLPFGTDFQYHPTLNSQVGGYRAQ